jgi:hypothetical protein
VSAITQDEEKFILTIFTIDGHIKQFLFDGLRSFQTFSGQFNKNLNLINAENLSYYESSCFALGSVTGTVYVVRFEIVGQIIHYQIIEEIKKSPNGLSQRISSMIPINLNFFSKQTAQESVSSLKFLNNNLLAIVMDNFNFRVYNLKRRKEIYSNCLIKNRTTETLLASRINFLNMDHQTQEIFQTRNKCFMFTIYIHYNCIHVLQAFDLLFINIPELQDQDLDSILQRDYKLYYDLMELGTDIQLKNTRVYKSEGPVLDTLQYNRRIWALISNIHDTDTRYELKVFSHEDEKVAETVLFLNDKRKNALNILNQLKLFKSFRFTREKDNPGYEMLMNFIKNEEYLDKDLLSNFIFQAFRVSYINKGDMISFIEKKFSWTPGQYRIQTEIEEFFTKILSEEIQNNKILSIGSFHNQEVDSLAFVRKNGFSLLRNLQGFLKINNRINMHEYYFRNLIFSSDDAGGYLTHNPLYLSDLQAKILNYITVQTKINTEDTLYTMLALLRIYCTESFSYFNNEKYIMSYFDEREIEDFFRSHFIQSLTNQFSNLTYLDFLHQVIFNVYLNHQSLVERHIKQILEEYKDYVGNRKTSSESLVKTERVGLKNTEKINSKFLEILSNLVRDKINSFFSVTRDLLNFEYWKKIYCKESKSDMDNFKYIFLECFALKLIASHLCRIERNGIESLSFLIDPNFKQKDVEVDFLELTIYDTIDKFGSRAFQDLHMDYIDYIILHIWPDLYFNQRKAFNIISVDSSHPNKKRRNIILSKLLNMREYKLLSVINKLQITNELENIFLDILCHVSLSDSDSRIKLKQSLNDYFMFLIDNTTSLNYLEMFTDFYNQISKNDTTKNNHYIDYSLNEENQYTRIIKGYYMLEERLKNLLTEEMRYEFYFNCYTFIYPTLLKLDNIDNNRAEEFLLNMIKSCIEIDIDMALSFYTSIKENLKQKSFNIKVVELFIQYFLENWAESSIKLLQADSSLIDYICSHLESKCEKLKENAKMLNLLKFQCSLQVTSIVIETELNLNTCTEKEKFYNYFLFLFNAYIHIGDLQKAATTMFCYSEAIQNVIAAYNIFSLNDLISLYTEKHKATESAIHCLELIGRHKTYTLFLGATNSIVTIEKLQNNNSIDNLRIEVLKKIRKLEITPGLEELNKIHNIDELLNYVFEYQLENLIIDSHIISSGSMNELLIKKFIKNYVLVNIQHNCCRNDRVVKYMDLFYKEIKRSENLSLIFYTLEALLFYSQKILPVELVVEAKKRNCKQLLELMMKYSKYDV